MDIIERKAIWVMTINRTFDTVTFWEAKNHKHYVLKYRIDPGEEPYLESYLSPNLSQEDKQKIEAIREQQKSLLDTLAEIDNDDIDVDLGRLPDSDDDDEDEEKADDDEGSDSNFEERLSKVIQYSDMDQSLKGDNIDYIGKIDALGKNTKEHLKNLNYDDREADQIEEKPANKFFAAQKEERERNERNRSDKHILPQEFKDPVTGKKHIDDFGKLPFSTIDVIFNHKNMWANLQNPNP